MPMFNIYTTIIYILYQRKNKLSNVMQDFFLKIWEQQDKNQNLPTRTHDKSIQPNKNLGLSNNEMHSSVIQSPNDNMERNMEKYYQSSLVG